MNAPADQIDERYVRTICTRLKENKRIRRKIPIGGRVHIDRQLPFLCVYRYPPDRTDDGTERLLYGEASYLTASGETSAFKGLNALIHGVVETLSGVFGSILIVEIWSTESIVNSGGDATCDRPPIFRILAPKESFLTPALQALKETLGRIKIMGNVAGAAVEHPGRIAPPGLYRLLRHEEQKKLGAHVIGLEVQPVYRDGATGEVYPLLLRALQRRFVVALKHGFFEFVRTETTHDAPHFLALGRRAMVKAVWDADTRLAEVSNALDLLLYLSPTNADSAYAGFRRLNYETVPVFRYRPRTIDPSLLKRKLFSIPLEEIEDPAVGHVFRETQENLDGRVTLLSDRGAPRFLFSSLRVFGGVSDELLSTAQHLLEVIPPRSHETGKDGNLDANGFAQLVAAEIAYYQRQYAEFTAGFEIRGDISGLLCSRGKLLIGRKTKIPRSRAHALIQHEVGTHLLTYYNGRAQPFKQLYLGLAGYDELQEGLAVLSEYLVGGLSRPRMRLLAARVVAVRRLVDGASFVDTFRELVGNHGLGKRTAFALVTRVYRSGGLTKDAAYLKGLVKLLQYLKEGGDLNVLFIGKFDIPHIRFIKELLWRRILNAPPVRPRYLEEPQIEQKLRELKLGLNPSDLIDRKKQKRREP